MLHFVSYGSKVHAFCSSVTALLRLSFMFVGKIGVVNLGGGGRQGHVERWARKWNTDLCPVLYI